MEQNKNNKFTPLDTLGEFGLIDHLTKDLISGRLQFITHNRQLRPAYPH